MYGVFKYWLSTHILRRTRSSKIDEWHTWRREKRQDATLLILDGYWQFKTVITKMKNEAALS